MVDIGSGRNVTYDRYHHLYRESEAEERDALNTYLRAHGRTTKPENRMAKPVPTQSARSSTPSSAAAARSG